MMYRIAVAEKSGMRVMTPPTSGAGDDSASLMAAAGRSLRRRTFAEAKRCLLR